MQKLIWNIVKNIFDGVAFNTKITFQKDVSLLKMS